MIRYFREGLRLSIWAQLDTRGQELDTWEEAVEKAVNVEIKALLQSTLSTRKIDQHCQRSKYPAYTTVAKLQVSARDPRDKSSAPSTWHPQDKPPRCSQPHFLWSMSGETFKKDFWKEKKK